MTKLIVTTDENGTIQIDFGIYYSLGVVSFSKAYYAKSYIIKSHLMDDCVLVWGSDMRTFDVIAPDGDTTKGLIVESFNGVTPNNLQHLFDLVKTIM